MLRYLLGFAVLFAGSASAHTLIAHLDSTTAPAVQIAFKEAMTEVTKKFGKALKSDMHVYYDERTNLLRFVFDARAWLKPKVLKRKFDVETGEYRDHVLVQSSTAMQISNQFVFALAPRLKKTILKREGQKMGAVNYGYQVLFEHKKVSLVCNVIKIYLFSCQGAEVLTVDSSGNEEAWGERTASGSEFYIVTSPSPSNGRYFSSAYDFLGLKAPWK